MAKKKKPDPPRMLRNIKTGNTVVYTEQLAQRVDMVLVETDKEIMDRKLEELKELRAKAAALEKDLGIKPKKSKKEE